MVAHANLTRKQQSVPLFATVVDRRGVAGTLVHLERLTDESREWALFW